LRPSNLGSARKDTIGPKYGQVTLTGGIMRQTRCRLISRTSVLTFSHLYSDHSLYISGHVATNHQRASWPNNRPVITLKTTRNEPETPASGNRIHLSNRQGEPPPHTKSGDPHRPKGFRTPPRAPLPSSLVKPGTPGT
jgi:hypothetical protein